jgi:hypothetical protein
MKHKARQMEITWASEPFALVQITAPDFEQAQNSARRRDEDRKQSEQQQTEFTNEQSKNQTEGKAALPEAVPWQGRPEAADG